MKFWCCFFFSNCVLAMNHKNETPSSCITPNGEEALCTAFFDCQHLGQAFFSGDESAKKFVKASLSSCGGGGATVCCGTAGNYTEHLNQDISNEKNSITKSKRDYALKNLLPDITYCGMQHADDYVHDQTHVSIDEYPWLVLIYGDDKTRSRKLADHVPDYRPPKVTYKCAGVLISTRYVLTSVSCASYTPMQVALGQYNEREKISCIGTPYGDDCTDPPINITVEEQIRSPIGRFLLLRLAEEISYTDSIRPICLPMNESIRPKTGDTIVTSGWTYDYGQGHKGEKKRSKFDINNECSFNSTEYIFCYAQYQLVCEVDNGGPMMYRYKSKNWYVEGIVDVNECYIHILSGFLITPKVVEWILENMKP